MWMSVPQPTSEIERDEDMERERNEENGRVEVDQVVDNGVGEQQNENGEMPDDAPITKDNGGSSGVGEKHHVTITSPTTTKSFNWISMKCLLPRRIESL
ncbi:hypothetical protein ACSQ67_011427 [Phaseolus vulgaris]